MSPRPGPRRHLVAVRLHTEAIARLDQRATDEELLRGGGEPNRSEMIRLMLAYADRHMPKRWRPH